jgi:hypothetical protein
VETLHRNKANKDRHPPNISFLVWGEFFPPLIKTKNVLTPLVLSSLKTLEDHLLWSKEFAQMVGNI